MAIESLRSQLGAGVRVASVASAAMLAQQVAGKATRDALYLSRFDVKTLPTVIGVSAIASFAAVLALSRLMTRYAPARVVPVAFAMSATLFVAEWALSFLAPGIAAVAVYFHTAIFGAAVISAFWSLANETFPPHTGRAAISWIAGAGTLGGALGGLAAWRASAAIAVPTMLPVLAAVNLLCLWGTIRLRAVTTAPSTAEPTEPLDPSAELVPRNDRHLKNLGVVVGLGAISATLLDYLFSAEALKTHTKGPELLAFFALFWLGVGVVSLGLQLLLGRVGVEKLGLAVSVATVPAAVLLGGALRFALPGLWTTVLLRGGEASQRASVFRAAYEQLYTPIPERDKRWAKPLIDVGLDRFGTVTASAVLMLALHFWPEPRAEDVLLATAMGCAVVSIARSRALHRGYLELLEQSLRAGAEKLEAESAPSALPPQERIDVRDELVEHLDSLRSADPTAFSLATGEPIPQLTPPEDATSPGVLALERPIRHLLSGNPAHVRAILRAEAPLPSPLVPFVILLLGDKELHLDAIVALRKIVSRCCGQLVDALCDPTSSFDVRRRIPRVLSEHATQDAADGLFRGLADERFEVRYACGRALLKIARADAIAIARERVIEAVEQECLRAKPTWESQALDEDGDDDSAALVDRLLRDRIDRSMEHVFNILALHLDPESLRTAFQALHTEDAHLRGTALEYLDSVLPDEVRDHVWPFVGAERPMRAERSASEILEDIRAATRPAAAEG
jgi:MFS family permease